MRLANFAEAEMIKAKFKATVILTLLVLGTPVLVGAQADGEVARLLNSGYDLLEAGNLDQAQKVYEQVLQRDAGNPLALNNLAAIMCKRGKFKQALDYLQQALGRAKGYTVTLNRVCSVDGVCAAYRKADDRFGNEDLEGLVKSNIIMVGMAATGAPR
jgi:Flp pilus assembly protein TadD